MWEPPRALMTAVLPTLLRRLTSNWQRASARNEPGRQSYDYFVPNNPLPEFVPGSLFADLNLPEVAIVTPPQQQGDVARTEPLPVLQAMREFMPGRVSRRFGIRNQWARHWIALPNKHPGVAEYLSLNNYLSRYDELGEFQFEDRGIVRSIRCVRPFELQPQIPSRDVLDTSNSFLRWNTQVVPESLGSEVDLPSPSRWDTIIRGVQFFTHNNHCPLEVRRFARAADATFALSGGNTFETRVTFVEEAFDGGIDDIHNSAPVAVGFAISVDGVAIHIRIPEDLHLDDMSPNRAKVRALRTSLFRDRVVADVALDGVANTFLRQWLADVYMSALVNAALTDQQSMLEAWEAIQQNRTMLDFAQVLQVIFQSIPVTTDDHDDAGHLALDELHQRLFHDLSDLLNDPTVIATLTQHAPTLWLPADDTWDEWLRAKFKVTCGAALLDAVQQLCPDLDAGDLMLDIESGPRPPGVPAPPEGLEEIWLTERTVGGGGIVEQFLSRYGEDPSAFSIYSRQR